MRELMKLLLEVVGRLSVWGLLWSIYFSIVRIHISWIIIVFVGSVIWVFLPVVFHIADKMFYKKMVKNE